MSTRRIAIMLLMAAAVLATAAVLAAARVWTWPGWSTFGQAVRDHPVVTGAGAVSVLLATSAVVLLRRHRTDVQSGTDDPSAARSRWGWLLTDRGVAAIVVATIGLGVAALLWMLTVAGAAPAGKDRATLRIEAIKYGLGAVAASGAVAALLLAVRRQRLAEVAQLLAERVHDLARQAQAHTEVDARARRVTDLYTKAVEQLGSTDAAVRLGGLYALERVAQDNPDQRQTIVNVICAYLRMPYTPPQPPSTTTLTDPSEAAPSRETTEPLPSTAPVIRDPEQERQVRLTAQRILTTHLTAPTNTAPDQAQHLPADPEQPFWRAIDLDLTGATLLNWQLHRGSLHHATFDQSRFIGAAEFGEATFTGGAWFGGATFTSVARFGGATFTSGAWFDGATFTSVARFDGATFTSVARFDGATFTGVARFDGATFTGVAWFGGATFTGVARFDGATFTSVAWFGKAAFTGAAWFGRATFARDPTFETTWVQLRPDRDDSWPPGWCVVPSADDPAMGLLHRSVTATAAGAGQEPAGEPSG